MHEAAVAYGDDIPSRSQRTVAFAAVVIAFAEMAYGWLVAGMMAAAPNPRLTLYTLVLSIIVIANGSLLFGRARPPRDWLRISSAVSIFLMVGAPTLLVLTVIANGS